MGTHTRAALFILTGLMVLMVVAPASVLEGAEKITVTPLQVPAGSYQEMRFEFTVGEPGMATGGGVRLELPVAYLETAPYYWDRPQTTQPEARGYVKATCTGNAELKIRLSGGSGGIVECELEQESLKPGETVVIAYQGIVQSLSWKVPVRMQWRKTAQEEWKDVAEAPVLKIVPQQAVVMVAVAPAEVKRGAEFELAVVLLDRFGNRASGYRGTVSFSSADPQALVPESYTFSEEDAGVHVFKEVKYSDTGLQRIEVTDGELKAQSNYSKVGEDLPAFKRYFGDTHYHTGSGTMNKKFITGRAGGDHRGHFTTEDETYEYLREVMRLDFGSAAEHDGPEMNEEVWAHCEAITDAHNEPGKFTAFFAYEWTAKPNVGHHLVVYKDRGGKVFCRTVYPTKPELFKALDEQDKAALVIPHCMWAQPDHGIWNHIHNEYQRVGEIYSLWNNRFLLQPADDVQRFELGINDKWSYQYAWHKGHKIGVIGSSDNHTGHPGMNNYTVDMQHPSGLAVVLAKENTREAIWDAFQKRRVYATTGTRIYLDFSSDGHLMGEEYAASSPPVLQVKVAGTNELVSVELVKHDSQGYTIAHKEEPEGAICSFEYTDKEFSEDSFYYVRATQVDEYPRGNWAYPTTEMAWSSPIWVNWGR